MAAAMTSRTTEIIRMIIISVIVRLIRSFFRSPRMTETNKMLPARAAARYAMISGMPWRKNLRNACGRAARPREFLIRSPIM